MKERRVYETVMQWLLPVGVLLLIVIILLVRFTVTGRLEERDEVENKVITTTQGYAGKVEQLLYGAQQSTNAVAAYVAKQPEEEVDMQAALEAVSETSGAYDAVICNADGMGYRANGEEIDLSGVGYFDTVRAGKSQVLYVADDGMSGADALLVISPVTRMGEVQAYVLCYYYTYIFDKLVQKMHLDEDAFYIVMENTGRVVYVAGDTDSSLCTVTEDYFSFLKQAGDNSRAEENMQTRIQNGNYGIGYFSDGNEERNIAYAPIGIGGFYLLAGVGEDYIESNEASEWAASGSMVLQLVIVMLAFVGLVVILNIIVWIKDREKSKELADKADTDLLTDLYNKIATERKIKEYLAEHPDQMGLLFVLDIDNFKKINDTLGHAFGDEVLRTLGKRIRSEFRATDIIGRTGGDEFTIFLCNMKEDAIIKSEASRLERFFKDFQAGDYVKYSATASIGAAVYPRDARDFEGLYKAADQALYAAKKRGKNQLAFYGDDK